VVLGVVPRRPKAVRACLGNGACFHFAGRTLSGFQPRPGIRGVRYVLVPPRPLDMQGR
jgi:hypothetical protein